MDRFLQGARRAVGEDTALLSRAGFRAGLRTSNSGDTRRLPVTGGVLSGLSLVTVAGAVPELHRLPDYPDVSLGEFGTLKARDYKEGKGRGQLTGVGARAVRRGLMRVKLAAS